MHLYASFPLCFDVLEHQKPYIAPKTYRKGFCVHGRCGAQLRPLPLQLERRLSPLIAPERILKEAELYCMRVGRPDRACRAATGSSDPGAILGEGFLDLEPGRAYDDS